MSGFKVGANSEGSSIVFCPGRVQTSTGDLERELSELFAELGEVAKEHGTGVVFLIDEMQFLKKDEMEAVAAAMHRMSQRQLPLALAGTGLPQLPGLMVEAKSYAERLFSYPKLDRLADEDAIEALRAPAQAEGIDYSDDALARMLELSGNYPALLPAYGKDVWNIAPRSPITLEDVTAAEPIVQSKLDEEFFHTRLRRQHPRNDDICQPWPTWATAADQPGCPQTPGLQNQQRRVGARDSLIKKGLIYSPDQARRLHCPRTSRRCLRRSYPLTDPN